MKKTLFSIIDLTSDDESPLKQHVRVLPPTLDDQLRPDTELSVT